MPKEEMIKDLMAKLEQEPNSEAIYRIAEFFYQKWLESQDATVVHDLYYGNKEYWEV